MTRDEMLAYARDRYERARRESDELMRLMASGEIDRETWRAQDARVRGMREAYAGMIGALGEIL